MFRDRPIPIKRENTEKSHRPKETKDVKDHKEAHDYRERRVSKVSGDHKYQRDNREDRNYPPRKKDEHRSYEHRKPEKVYSDAYSSDESDSYSSSSPSSQYSSKICFRQVLIEAEADMRTTIAGGTPGRAERIVAIGTTTIEGMIEKGLRRGLMIGSIVRRKMTGIIRIMMARGIRILVRGGKSMMIMRKERITGNLLSGRRKRSTREEIYLLKESLKSEGRIERMIGGMSGESILGGMRGSMRVGRRSTRRLQLMSQRRGSIMRIENTGGRRVRGIHGTSIRRVTMDVGMGAMRGETRNLGIMV